MIRILLLVLILFLFCNPSSAATIANDSIIRISGQVVNKSSLNPIPQAHLIVKGKRSGQICDSLGIFHLQINQSDTLIISALGFKTQEWPIPFIFDTTLPSFFQIPLEKMVYLLKEVNVFALGTWDEFKNDFRKLEIKDEYVLNSQITKELAPFQTKKPNIVPPQYRPIIEDFSVWNAIGTPASFLFSKFSKSEKRKRKVAKMIRNKWQVKILNQYYTSKIVAANTGLSGKELDDFMAYCGPKLKITQTTSQYDILEQIVNYYKDYITLKKENKALK
ncbi:carboxypeptidase-like regulatory domain-containing protein [Ancylomarina salipaludis]|uniref:Carboxypeptidase-like regulatory domain-containing protein n=1 Tax=Ancylomarina salipaludis TaxID=2501299 RepID=A0A4Q1JNH8_9BACT|nr:carboxypeptidase-like regulatory domain-containing protein [Ancylomarina salipaludis]RXQ95676.1 carboxypeptidase-like regulatory domain-containing protein [Ancylomarina salipaludis]